MQATWKSEEAVLRTQNDTSGSRRVRNTLSFRVVLASLERTGGDPVAM